MGEAIIHYLYYCGQLYTFCSGELTHNPGRPYSSGTALMEGRLSNDGCLADEAEDGLCIWVDYLYQDLLCDRLYASGG